MWIFERSDPDGGWEEAPHRIRQSRSCRGREQSCAPSGVRHALLPPVADGSSAPWGAELLLLSWTDEAPSRKAEINRDAWEALHSGTFRLVDKPKEGRVAV